MPFGRSGVSAGYSAADPAGAVAAAACMHPPIKAILMHSKAHIVMQRCGTYLGYCLLHKRDMLPFHQ
jgi:hypothetical protein